MADPRWSGLLFELGKLETQGKGLAMLKDQLATDALQQKSLHRLQQQQQYQHQRQGAGPGGRGGGPAASAPTMAAQNRESQISTMLHRPA